MRRPSRLRVPVWLPASAAVASVVCLLAPWLRSGRVERSTVGLLSSASALEVWTGREEVLALAAWYSLPLLAAAAVVGAGWQRPTFSAACVLPIGPLMAMAWLAVVWSPFEARWGAAAGTLLGLMASLLGGLLLMSKTNPAEGNQ